MVVTEKIGRIPQNTPGTVVEVISQGTRDEQCVVTCAVGGGEVERPVPVALLKSMDDDDDSQDSDEADDKCHNRGKTQPQVGRQLAHSSTKLDERDDRRQH